MESIISFAKRRGFIFPGSEIYGGIGGVYDYGPLGVAFCQNIKRYWWKRVVQEREDVVGIDSAILMNAKVWEASGHLAHFSDPLVECRVCHRRFRADEIGDVKQCPYCASEEMTEERRFNTMFKTFVGPVETEAAVTYLRPETAAGIFMNFANVLDTSRRALPFGIAQIGKAFRNEITPGNFIFRVREFEQMEIEYFTHPEEADRAFEEWKAFSLQFFRDIGIEGKNLRFREHSKEELAHYAARTVDIEYRFPFGWGELMGLANRGDFDLAQHAKHSGKDLSYFDPVRKTRIIPYVIEPSFGVGRTLLALLLDAYEEVEGARTKTTEAAKEKEAVLHLRPFLAPVKAAVFPLVRKAPLIEAARHIYERLRPIWMTAYDETGSIGRRYRRQDEIGTPFCITVDFQTLEDGTVTIRTRDSMKQERAARERIVPRLSEKLSDA